ncbi:hypothetical protein DERP_010884 [Dermatophagoides pteronyssinus]|uniref:THAP-type domain-containing protein n=1 Tax=Dermatophagoides pteronyssinus TaxID=6956 RepID=A0ABQ8JUP5_DERPT|nr:hypothetical protein DERP_010884 [Dermatophagoides pteronyssinus]
MNDVKRIHCEKFPRYSITKQTKKSFKFLLGRNKSYHIRNGWMFRCSNDNSVLFGDNYIICQKHFLDSEIKT